MGVHENELDLIDSSLLTLNLLFRRWNGTSDLRADHLYR